MRNYGVNIFDLVVKLVPVKIRNPRFSQWIGSLVAPIQSLNSYLVGLVSDIRYKLLFDGQVIYLEHVLNDTFDATNREIYIDDPGSYVDENYVFNHPFDSLILYNKVESQAPLYIYNAEEYNDLNVDFVVFIPSTIVFNPSVEVQLRQIIDRYRHVGRRYRFQIYTP